MDAKNHFMEMDIETFVDGIHVPTKHKTIYTGGGYLDVSAGCNGYQGGDGNHGGRTFFKISFPDAGIWAETKRDSISLFGAGDLEMSSIIKALRFIVETLEEQSGGSLSEIPDDDEIPF